MRYVVDTDSCTHEFDNVSDLKEWALSIPCSGDCVPINSITDESGRQFGLEWDVKVVCLSDYEFEVRLLSTLAIELTIPQGCVKACSRAGSRDTDVALYVNAYHNELSKIPPATARIILKSTGGYTDQELEDYEANLGRILWDACCTADQAEENIVVLEGVWS